MIYQIKSIRPELKKHVGTKAFNLSQLGKNGFKIADGIVVGIEIYEYFVKTGKIKNFDSIIQEVKTFSNDKTHLIVRSSANFEDGDTLSFAGIFESFLKVSISEIKDAILKIYASVSSPKALEYFEKNGINIEQIKMSILIQEYIDPLVSGVCFTKNPLTFEDQFVIEYVVGSNQKFVSGIEKSKKLVVEKKENIEINSENNYENLILRKIEEFSKIEEFFAKPQDIEWGIDKNNQLFVFQSRSVNTKKGNEIQKEIRLKVIAHGYGLSSGIKSGKIKMINTNLKFHELEESINKDSIILTDNLRVDQIIAIKKAAGIIVSETSLLSHTAIQAREFGIPCIGGIYERSLFVEGQEVTIDGFKGLLFEGIIHKDGIDGNFDTQNEYQNFPNYYTPEKISEYKTADFTFLYSIQEDTCMIYLSNVEDTALEEKAKNIINQVFSIDKDKILSNQIKVYENKNAPSSVFSYYKDYIKVKNNPEFSMILEQAKVYMENLDTDKLKDLADSTRKKSYLIFKNGYNLFLEFKKNKDVDLLIKSGKYLDEALNLAILFSNVIIFSYGNYYLEKHIKNENSVSLKDFFVNPSKFSPKLREFSKFLTSYKNSELEPLQQGNTTMIDIIDYIYENGFEEYVKEYNW